jgi:hypothetical protein
MKLFLRVSFFTSILIFICISGNTQTTWEKLFSKKSTDSFRCVIEASAGGYVIAGYTSDSTVNDTDAYVVRMTTAGDTLWTKRINGTNNGKDLLYKVINTNDGGYAFCGYSTNNGIGNDDAYFMKMDANGNVLWSKYWGGAGKDRAQDIIQTSDGGFAIAGYTTTAPAAYYDAFLIKTNSSGDTTWVKRYGTGGFDDANTLVQHPDGGFVLGGQSTNGGTGLDMYMVRTDAGGNQLWTRKFGTMGTDNIEHIIRQSDGTYILTGGTDGPGLGGNDGSLVKTDSGGTVIWSKIYGGNSQDDFHQVYKTNDGGFLMSGTSRSSGALEPNMWLMKTNSSGDSTWSKTYGGDNHDHGYSAVQTADGGYIFVGYTSSFGFNGEDAYVVKTNSAGNIGNYLTYASVSSLAQPLHGSCTASNVQVKVVVRNYGRDTLPNVPVTIQISGPVNQTINQTYNGSVYPGDLDTLTFSTTINFTTPGLYTFNCTSSNLNDVFPQNNNLLTTINIVGYSSPPSTTPGSRCGTGSISLSATSPDSIFWYSASSGGSLLGTGSVYNTPSISATTTYYAQAGFACPSSRVATLATVVSAPVAPTTTSAQRCGTGTVVLGASAADPVRWFDASTGGTQVGSGTSFTTPTLSSTTTYYAEAYNGVCGSTRVGATATVNPATPAPVTTGASRCDAGTVTLTATASNPVTWYDAASGGNIVGSGTSFITPVLNTTTIYYAEASNGICPSTRVSAQATISSQVADPTVSPGSSCGPGTVVLGASSNETLIWYATSSGGSQLGVGTSFTTPFLNTSTTYYVLATNGACPSNYIAVQATIHTLPSVNIGPDTSLGFGSTYLLDPGAGFSSYSWTGGSTSQTLTVNVTGTYCVTVTDANNCTATDCANVQISVGMDEAGIENMISLYPNPVSDKLFIEIKQETGTTRYQLISAEGKILKEEQFSEIQPGTVLPVSVSELSEGVYLMRIFTKQWTGTLRILKN